MATITLSRAGKADRCVASISLKGVDGKPVLEAATAKVQWAGEAAAQQVRSSAKAPGRLFTTSGTPSVPTKGCEVQLLEVTVAGQFGPVADSGTLGLLVLHAYLLLLLLLS